VEKAGTTSGRGVGSGKRAGVQEVGAENGEVSALEYLLYKAITDNTFLFLRMCAPRWKTAKPVRIRL
jgi:hypothetical protein